MKIENGFKFKVENVFLEGVHSREEYEVISVDEVANKVKVKNLRSGLCEIELLEKDGFGQRSLINSLNRRNKTGFVYTAITQLAKEE